MLNLINGETMNSRSTNILKLLKIFAVTVSTVLSFSLVIQTIFVAFADTKDA